MRRMTRFGNLEVGDEFLFERRTGRWVRFRKIASLGAVLGEDFAERNAIELGGDAEALIAISDDTPCDVFMKDSSL